MFSVLADALFTASRTKRDTPDATKDWADRFIPEHRRKGGLDQYKFNPYRDLW